MKTKKQVPITALAKRKENKMKQLQIFVNSEFGQVRTLKDDGRVLFCGSDVAKALGYVNTRKALIDHCRCVTKRDTPHPQSEDKEISMTFISEGDLYRLIVSSKLPSAEKFESWVFDEVLPSIRKNGGYINNQAEMSPEQLVAKALLVAQNIIESKQKEIDTLKPKALFADAVTASNNSILIGELAKILKQNGVENMGQNRLFNWLRDNGYLIRRKGDSYNSPTQKSMELKLFELKESCVTHSDGVVTINKTTKVTGKGQQYFVNLFLS